VEFACDSCKKKPVNDCSVSRQLECDREGDWKPFDGILERWLLALLICRIVKLTRDVDEAADVNTDVYIKLRKVIHSFRRDKCGYAWVVQIASNLAVDGFRKMKPDHLGDADKELVDKFDVSVDEQAEQEELMAIMREAIANLSAEVRELLWLKYWVGLTEDEIGQQLGTPKGTISSRLSRIRNDLEEKLKPHFGENSVQL